jgi:hypothetical protein
MLLLSCFEHDMWCRGAWLLLLRVGSGQDSMHVVELKPSTCISFKQLCAPLVCASSVWVSFVINA